MTPSSLLHRSVSVGALLILLGLPGPDHARAQQGNVPVPERPEPSQSTPAPEPTPPPAQPEIHPDAVSRFVERDYKIRPKKIWKGLLQALKDAGYPPEEVDEGRMHVKTSFVDFQAKDYPDPVADPPPLFGPDYPIMQMTRVRDGKVSLEAILVAEKHETRLSLRARILVQGLDRRQRIHVLTDRRSSGAIEKTFLARLEGALQIEPR
jgi:hypothetical protein